VTIGVLRGGGLGVSNTLRNSKALQNRTKLNTVVKTVKNFLNLGRQHPQDFRKKGSKILKLPPVRSCFTLAMTNKLVVIINNINLLLSELFFLILAHPVYKM
jgi:hypothetical protein